MAKTITTISLCMIVRDEEKYLGEALESIKGFVDEIVIVDTGSKDKTVEIAKSFGARVEVHPWKDNFSLHRNQSLKMAQMQWIMIFDADDRLFEGDGEKIREFLSECKTDLAKAFIINSASKGNETSMKQIRFIRRGSKFKYTGRVHNRLEIPIGYEIAQAPARIRHIGYDLSPEETKKKHTRTIKLLEIEMKEKPDDAYLIEHYAQQFRIEGEFKNPKTCLEYSSVAAGLTSPRLMASWWVHLRSLNMMSWSLLELEQYDQAISIAREILYFKNNYLDAMLCLAFAYKNKGGAYESIQWFENYIESANKHDPLKHADGATIQFPNMQKVARAEIIEIKNILNKTKGGKKCSTSRKLRRESKSLH